MATPSFLAAPLVGLVTALTLWPVQPEPANEAANEEQHLVTWARERFSLAGLDLPTVDVRFHDVTDPCGGNDGMYRREHDHHEVSICVRDRPTFAVELHRKRTLLHELAHVWEQANLTDDRRTELTTVLEAESWYGPDDAWEHRGAERFAETVVWGLYDQRRRPTLIDASCQELHADFVSITGMSALGPLEPACRLLPE